MTAMAENAAAAPEFVITRVFKAPRKKVWDAWTKPEQIAQWLGPKGTTTTVMHADVRPGGMLHSRMVTPEGQAMWGKFVYREVVEPSRLVWVHAFSDERANVVRAPFFEGRWPLELLTTVVFEEAGPGTRITLTWVPLNATPEERATFAANMVSMTGGWSGSFDQLDEMLARE